MKRIQQGLLAWICAACLAGCAKKQPEVIFESAYVDGWTSQERGTEEETASFATEAVSAPEKIVVDISGAVARPGVYELRADARVCDAVEAAGGLTADADVDSLNQAQLLADAQKIRVFTVQEAAQGAAADIAQADGAQTEGGKVNINTADAALLATLSGIGESRARDIIAYREANGAFQSIEDIMKVSGIKQATFNRIKDAIAVG